MPLLQRALTLAGLFLVWPALLLGLRQRRLYRVCYSFTVYLGCVWLGDILVLTSPSHFYTWSFFQAKETAYGFLKFAVALELASLTFQAFPGAKRTARRVVFLMLVFILIGILFGPAPNWSARTLALAFLPRLANGTALLFAAVWGLILWYNVPVHPFHRAILRGFVPYLLTFTVVLGLVELVDTSQTLRTTVRMADGLSYTAMLLYWTYVVWRPPQESANPELLRKLQPWRDRLSG